MEKITSPKSLTGKTGDLESSKTPHPAGRSHRRARGARRCEERVERVDAEAKEAAWRVGRQAPEASLASRAERIIADARQVRLKIYPPFLAQQAGQEHPATASAASPRAASERKGAARKQLSAPRDARWCTRALGEEWQAEGLAGRVDGRLRAWHVGRPGFAILIRRLRHHRRRLICCALRL